MSELPIERKSGWLECMEIGRGRLVELRVILAQEPPTAQGSNTTHTTQSSTTYGAEEVCKTCGPDYVPETPPISSDARGYYYDRCRLD